MEYFAKLFEFLTSATGWISLVFFLVLLPLSFIKITRGFSGKAYVALSYVVGLMLWIYSALVSYYLWGLTAVIVGVLFFGFGVFPIALLASLFNNEWGLLINIVYLGALTYGARMYGLHLIEKSEYE